jgi:predicted Zn-dependent peptidase
LGSNQKLAALLPSFYANHGDWRALFAIAPQYDRLTSEELQRVALQYLIPAGRTVAYRTNPPEPGGAASSQRGIQ